MIKLKEILTEAEVSRELWYHINNDISLEECVFRYGSPKYFTIINEARLLQCEQNIDFDNQTRALLETDLGKFATYKGEEVALDFPMINEAIFKLNENAFVEAFKLEKALKGMGYDVKVKYLDDFWIVTGKLKQLLHLYM